jgi:hypothetical protein
LRKQSKEAGGISKRPIFGLYVSDFSICDLAPSPNESLTEPTNSSKERSKTSEAMRARYTLEFKLEAVRLVDAGKAWRR